MELHPWYKSKVSCWLTYVFLPSYLDLILHRVPAFFQSKAEMATNGSNGATHKFDPDFTKNVINATGPKTSPRLRKLIGGLIQHLHDFARENELTVDEWMTAVNFVRYSFLIISMLYLI